jgi:hypothetical protein
MIYFITLYTVLIYFSRWDQRVTVAPPGGRGHAGDLDLPKRCKVR